MKALNTKKSRFYHYSESTADSGLGRTLDATLAARPCCLWACGYFYSIHQSIMSRKVAAGSNKATNPPCPLPPLCGHCQQPAQPGKSLLVCSSCHEACYCSAEHQVADWNCHKVLCKQRKKELKKEKERKESDAAINYLLLNPPIAAHPTAAELFESLCIACSEGEVG